MRIDVYLVENKFFPAREKAKIAIIQGCVSVNNKVIDKASLMLEETDLVEVADNSLMKYVSLGGFKLEKAIEAFRFDFTGKTVLDIGASTGGFIDCALQHGATKAIGVDVGTEQLHESLKEDSRVQSFENQNIKEFVLDEKVDVILMDVSFTSQNLLFPFLQKFLNENGTFISLIKPQFELDQRLRFSNGIVKDKKLHVKVLQKTVSEAAKHGFFVQKIIKAPLQPKKNEEYLALFYNYPPVQFVDLKKVVELVEK
jgi:23S rRNA (cytidine1920-2'-O)/16S rRNA (cytidine1409-2'-O)-methyltransferase